MWLEHQWAAEHNKQHTNMPVAMAVPARARAGQAAPLLPAFSRMGCDQMKWVRRPPLTPKGWLPAPKSSQTSTMNTNMCKYKIFVYKIGHFVLIQEESSSTLNTKCVQFVHLALTEAESLLTLSIPDHSVVLNRAVGMAAK